MQLLQVGIELGVGEAVDYAAMFHDVIAVRNGRGEAKILLDQKNRETLLFEQADSVANLLNNHRSQALGWLIEKQQPSPGAQDTSDGKHLLLAPRQLRALASQSLLQIGKQLENSGQLEAVGLHLGRQQQVFLHAQARENPALFRAQRDAEPRDPVAGQIDQLAALIEYRAGTLTDDAHDRFQGRGFAGAIAAEQRHHFARQHLETRTVQHMGLPIPRLQPFNRQQWRNRS